MRQFPILISYRGTKGPCPSSIPWEAIAPYEGMAKVNHDQTLERLAERGGLDPVEAFFVMTGRKWTMVPVGDEVEKEACAFLDKIVKDPIRLERDALLLQVGELKKALYDECRGIVCANEVAPCYGGYRLCSGCEERAKRAYGPGWGDVAEKRCHEGDGHICIAAEGVPCSLCGRGVKET